MKNKRKKMKNENENKNMKTEYGPYFSIKSKPVFDLNKNVLS